MIATFISLIVLILCCLVTLRTYLTHIYRNMCGSPPGPIPIPVIGNLHQLGIMAHEHLRVLSQTYGNVMRILIGSELAIVVSGTKEVLEGLVTKGVDFAGRPITYTLSLTSSGGKGIAFADYSPRWRFFRKIGHSSMKMYGEGIKTIEKLVTKESLKLHNRLCEQLATPVDLHHDLGLAVCNVVSAMIFGKHYDISDPEFQALIKSSTLFVRGFEYDSFIDVFPILRFLPNKRIKTILYALSLRNPIIKKNLQHHKDTFTQENKKTDLAYALLSALHDAVEKNEETRHYLTDDLLMAVLDDMIGAGSETTLTVLRWAVVYLVNAPDVQEMCFEEIQKAIGRNRLPTLEDRHLLPYNDAFIHETLRMSSIAPLAVPHKTTCDTSIGGYSVSKNTQVIFNLYALHRSEKDWVEPFKFDPTRFLDDNGKLVPPGYHRAYLPFSAGRRICLAESLAKMEIFLVVTQLVSRFKFLPAPGHPLPSMIGVPGLFLSPVPHNILIEKR